MVYSRWYAETDARDELIQRFTTESPTLTAEAVRAAIVELLAEPADAAGFLIAKAISGERLGNIALRQGIPGRPSHTNFAGSPPDSPIATASDEHPHLPHLAQYVRSVQSAVRELAEVRATRCGPAAGALGLGAVLGGGLAW